MRVPALSEKSPGFGLVLRDRVVTEFWIQVRVGFVPLGCKESSIKTPESTPKKRQRDPDVVEVDGK